MDLRQWSFSSERTAPMRHLSAATPTSGPSPSTCVPKVNGIRGHALESFAPESPNGCRQPWGTCKTSTPSFWRLEGYRSTSFLPTTLNPQRLLTFPSLFQGDHHWVPLFELARNYMGSVDQGDNVETSLGTFSWA